MVERYFLPVFLMFCAVALWWVFLSPKKTGMQEFTARVVRVVDGDSLYLQGRRAQIRLWGVDAPEYDQQGGSEATALLTALALGKMVRCRMMDTDHYGRTVARLFLADGQEINRLMIKSGKAREYRRFTKGFYSR
jgi:endonuclease YncB( thermonuclease family)